MPLHLAARDSSRPRARHIIGALALGAAALFAAQHYMKAPSHRQAAQAMPEHPAAAAATSSTTASPPGRWTIVFERPETCDASCAQVMDTLNSVARDPASGVPDGDAQVVVTPQAQPARDLIVLDPEGRPAGFISHTTDPGRIVSGLATLRASSSAGTPIASR
jgi:hypothetical protein